MKNWIPVTRDADRGGYSPLDGCKNELSYLHSHPEKGEGAKVPPVVRAHQDHNMQHKLIEPAEVVKEGPSKFVTYGGMDHMGEHFSREA
jgi:hypothetical protein